MEVKCWLVFISPGLVILTYIYSLVLITSSGYRQVRATTLAVYPLKDLFSHLYCVPFFLFLSLLFELVVDTFPNFDVMDSF